ncbi:hypothetical protein pb186bvf_010142 [Paramecium bursaria]
MHLLKHQLQIYKLSQKVIIFNYIFNYQLCKSDQDKSQHATVVYNTCSFETFTIRQTRKSSQERRTLHHDLIGGAAYALSGGDQTARRLNFFWVVQKDILSKKQQPQKNCEMTLFIIWFLINQDKQQKLKTYNFCMILDVKRTIYLSNYKRVKNIMEDFQQCAQVLDIHFLDIHFFDIHFLDIPFLDIHFFDIHFLDIHFF